VSDGKASVALDAARGPAGAPLQGAIVAGFDVHRRQITFDAVDTETGEVLCGKIDSTPVAVEEWVARQLRDPPRCRWSGRRDRSDRSPGLPRKEEPVLARFRLARHRALDDLGQRWSRLSDPRDAEVRRLAGAAHRSLGHRLYRSPTKAATQRRDRSRRRAAAAGRLRWLHSADGSRLSGRSLPSR
jgi:hypothetical protein